MIYEFSTINIPSYCSIYLLLLVFGQCEINKPLKNELKSNFCNDTDKIKKKIKHSVA